MCGGVDYTYQSEAYRYYFPNPKAVLPVYMKDGAVHLMPWGRRNHQHGQLPLGGWARLDSIYAGRWARYSPIPVKMPIARFMEKDVERHSHWFDMAEGKWMQGLVASNSQEQRIYVVTVEASADAVHDRWPRILAG